MSQSAVRSVPINAPDEASSFWWIYLIVGTLWLLLAVIMLRFDYTSVSAISILFGIVMLAAAVTELIALFATHGWWRLLHLALAAAFVVLAVVSFVHPGNTFRALAAIFSFYFIIKGAFTIVWAIAFHATVDLWWLSLLVGIAELLLGFWAAGDYAQSAVLLVAWIGILALLRGLTEIFFAFAVRHEGKRLSAA